MGSRAPLVHEGREVGYAEVNLDENTLVCHFNLEELKLREVVELFFVTPDDKYEINVFTPIENTKE